MADRVDDRANVVRGREATHRHLTRLRIDRDLGHLCSEGRHGAVRLGVVEMRGLERSALAGRGPGDRGERLAGQAELRGLVLELSLWLFRGIVSRATARVRVAAPP